jgi:primosomal protein N' (replication factor Y) (superfamily II helicase)
VSRYVEVCFETPNDATYFYRVPDDFPDELPAGMRVRAPLGPRSADGYLLRVVSEHEVRTAMAAKLASKRSKAKPKSKPKSSSRRVQQAELFSAPEESAEARKPAEETATDPLDAVRELARPSDEEPYLTERLVELARWMSGRYAASLGECLGALLPAPVKKHTKPEKIRYAELAVEPCEAPEVAAKLASRAPQQAVILETLAECGDRLTVGELLLAADVGQSAVRALAKKGHIRVVEEYQQDRVFMGYGTEQTEGFELTEEQAAVVQAVTASMAGEPGAVHLIRGVTGSGKTEVYIRAALHAVERGCQAIVLLPEISLTPQTCARFRGRFKGLAVLHSHLTAGQRAEEWRRIKSGQAEVVIGARSAVFAPVPRLGLIVVDEEHESSYKQDSPPRYGTCSVAVKRAELEGAVCVLGSATPSLESFQAGLSGTYKLHHMEKRVAGRKLPPVEIIDTRVEFREKRFFVALSHRLCKLLEACLAEEGSAIMFLNRRGWSTAVICNRCGYVARCQHCNVALVFHRDRNSALCHYCGCEEQLGQSCPDCGKPGLKHIGLGTEKVVEEVRKFFPQARVGRLDSDVMSKRTSHAHILSDFREGRLDVLVGTQMVGKGLDFPNVTLVGMISADTALSLPDFRAAERTFQLISQVAGRAGRGEKGGRVAVQTAMSEHPAVRAAAAHDYLEFAARELDSRREHFWPPFARLVRVVIRGPDAAKVTEKARKIAEDIRAAVEELGPSLPGTRSPSLLGPAPCPLERLDENWRWHLLLKCPHGDWMTQLLPRVRAAASGRRGKVRAVVDVEPGTML